MESKEEIMRKRGWKAGKKLGERGGGKQGRNKEKEGWKARKKLGERGGGKQGRN